MSQTMKELVEAYNLLAVARNLPTISRFRSIETGQQSLAKLKRLSEAAGNHQPAEPPPRKQARLRATPGTKPKVAKTTVKLPSVKQREAATRLARRKRTVASVCQLLILEGKSNEEIWERIRKEFKLGASKKHYPNWYRNYLKRKHLIR